MISVLEKKRQQRLPIVEYLGYSIREEWRRIESRGDGSLKEKSIAAVLVCISTSSVRGFPFLHTLSSIYCL